MEEYMNLLQLIGDAGLQEKEAVKFGICHLEKAIIEKQIEVKVVLTMSKELKPQEYQILDVTDNKINFSVCEESGAMYALLDLARKIENGYKIKSIEKRKHTPYIEQRGIKFNLPLDARTPSYSDSGDSAQENILNMWDKEFWIRFLDKMAEYKYNTLSLWSLHPFPSMVKVPGYEDVALEDVMRSTYPIYGKLNGAEFVTEQIKAHMIIIKKMTIEEKIEFWQWMMAYAKERCIAIYLFTWNVFTYGTEHTKYGITKDMKNEITKDYFRKSVKAMIETYPYLAGIGMTPGEQMSHRADMEGDLQWLMDTYGRGIMDALGNESSRPMTLINRLSPYDFFVAGGDTVEKDDSKIDQAHKTGLEKMRDIFGEFPYTFEVSFKYSQAHMYANEKPMFGEGFFQMLSSTEKTWLTVRNDDFYLLRWGDPNFAREYIKNMPVDVTRGFFMGPDGYIWGKEYAEKNVCEPELYIEKMWYAFQIWGELSYDNTLSDKYFQRTLVSRYGEERGEKVFLAMQASSKAIPLFQSMCWRNLDFHWYPEACCSYLANEEGQVVFRDIISFIECPAATRSEFISIKDYCISKINGVEMKGILPINIIEQIKRECKKALELYESVDKIEDNKELNNMLEDIYAMSCLGLYYGIKAEAAISLCFYQLLVSEEKEDMCFIESYLLVRDQERIKYKEKALADITEAYEWWIKYSTVMDKYRPQRLTRFKTYISPKQFDGEARLDIDIVNGQ